MTHEDLAIILDDPKINKDTISNLSRDNTTPSANLLSKLELLTGITMFDLYSEEIEFDSIPAKPLTPGKVLDERDTPTYKKKEWPTMGLREFFSRTEEMFNELNRLKERIAVLEGKKGK